MTKKKLNLLIMNSLANVDTGGYSISCFTCTKDYCCHGKKTIDVSGIELKELKKFITPENMKRAKAQITAKALTGHYTCPFLEDGRCSIYNNRPIACASYGVISDPEGCKDPNGKSYYVNQMKILEPVFLKNLKLFKSYNDSGAFDLLDVFR